MGQYVNMYLFFSLLVVESVVVYELYLPYFLFDKVHWQFSAFTSFQLSKIFIFLFAKLSVLQDYWIYWV